ncbi:MAG: hypothetical protein EOO27_19410, partial [Comamonadaceae bacterium]
MSTDEGGAGSQQAGYSAIEFSYDRGVGVIRLNSPDRLNSFTAGMREELNRAIADLNARQDLRGVILT